MRDLHADTETVWEERRQVLDDMSGVAARLAEIASEAAARFPLRKPGAQFDEGMAEHEGAEPEPSGVAATDATTGALPDVGLREEQRVKASEEEAT
jgi:hypothetical protein